MRAQEFTKHFNKSRIFENTSQLPPNVIELIKKIAQSTAAPEHKKAMIDALITKYRDKQGVPEGFDELDAYIKDKQAVKPSGGAGIKRGSYGTGERKTGYSGKTVGLTPYGTGSAIPSNRDFGRPHSVPRAAPRGIDDYDANYRREVDEIQQGVGEERLDEFLPALAAGAGALGAAALRGVGALGAAALRGAGSLGSAAIRGAAARSLADKLTSGEEEGVAEATGDEKFDTMMKKVAKTPTQAQRNAERIRQKREREEETRKHFANGGGFGPSPADKLSIRKGVAEGSDDGYGYKSLSTEQIMKLIQSGNWEAVQDVVPGKHIQLRNNRNGKNTTVHVKREMAEGSDEFEVQLDGKTVPGPFNDFDHARNKASKLISYQKGEVAEVYVNGKLKMRLKLNTPHQHFDEHTAA